MRIALAHKRLAHQGGTERDLYRTAEGLRNLGHEIHLFCAEFTIPPPPGTFAHRVPVMRLGRTARLWSFALRAPQVLRKYPCDVVISFGRMIWQDVLRSGGGSHKVFLKKLAQEGGLWRRLWHNMSIYHRSLLALERRQFGLGHFKIVITVSGEARRELIDTYGIPEDKIVVLHNGVDQDRFHPAQRTRWRNAIRQTWGIPHDADVVLFVGSGFRRKGLDRLIRLWDSPQLHGAYLFVVGDDARIRRYKAWAEQQAPGKIVFTGQQDGVEKFYAAADLVALPAVQEAFGNVVLEALASGLPVVVSRCVGAAEVLEGPLADGVADRPDAPVELETKLVKMLKWSREPGCAVEARRLAEQYSWTNHFRQLEACLKRVCRQESSGSLP